MKKFTFTLILCLVSCLLLLTGYPSGAENKSVPLNVLGAPQRVFGDAHFIKEVAGGPLTAEQSFYLFSNERRSVEVYDRAGRFSTSIAVPRTSLEAFTVDTKGRVYLVDAEARRVKVMSSAGQEVGSFAVPRPSSLAALSDGSVVVSSATKDGLLHVFDASGRRLRSFGKPQPFDGQNYTRNRFLNSGKVLIDAADDIYFVPQYAPAPTVQKYSKDGRLIATFEVKGEAIDQQSEAAKRVLGQPSLNVLAGVNVINSAVIDPTTGHLWLCMNGSPNAGVVYEYDGGGKKLGEYAFVLKNQSGKARAISSVGHIVVRSPSVYVFTDGGNYLFNLRNTLAANALVFDLGNCGTAQNWNDCKSSCSKLDTNDDVDCKAILAQATNDSWVVTGSTCSADANGCNASVTKCNPENGNISVTYANKSCGGGGWDEW
jgi:hypothetical protein